LLRETWAEFSAAYVINQLKLENEPRYTSWGLLKRERLEKVREYELAGSPFEAVIAKFGKFNEDWLSGILFALGENFGYEIFSDVRFKSSPFELRLVQGDPVLLMYQLYPAIGENMWPFFERWNFPIDEDTDGDGLSNRAEIKFGTSPLAPDSDGDGLDDAEGIFIGTDPWNEDTDNDGLSDADEVKFWGTNPLMWDNAAQVRKTGEVIWGYRPCRSHSHSV